MSAKIFLVVSVIALGSAHAGKLGGVSMPDTLQVGGQQLSLNGMGLREATWLDVDVYVAGLYVENVSSNPAELVAADQPKVLILKFVRDVDRGDIVKAWNDGFAGNATVPIARLKPQIDQLNGWMTDLKKGDTLAFNYMPGRGVAVEINGKRKGVIEDAEFARSLYSIWLGPKPPNAGLKRGLLGRHAGT